MRNRSADTARSRLRGGEELRVAETGAMALFPLKGQEHIRVSQTPAPEGRCRR